MRFVIRNKCILSVMACQLPDASRVYVSDCLSVKVIQSHAFPSGFIEDGDTFRIIQFSEGQKISSNPLEFISLLRLPYTDFELAPVLNFVVKFLNQSFFAVLLRNHGRCRRSCRYRCRRGRILRHSCRFRGYRFGRRRRVLLRFVLLFACNQSGYTNKQQNPIHSLHRFPPV